MTEPFFKVPSKIFDQRLSPRDIAVYCCLCSHRNSTTNTAFPSRRTIAKECGIGKVDTVDKAIKALCTAGLIEKYHQYTANGEYSSNLYKIFDG